jgi:hypothetical protein
MRGVGERLHQGAGAGVLLLVAMYCGVPVAIETRLATKIFDEASDPAGSPVKP